MSNQRLFNEALAHIPNQEENEKQHWWAQQDLDDQWIEENTGDQNGYDQVQSE